MSLADGVRLALRALAANKLRTSLTVLGMVIGESLAVICFILGTTTVFSLVKTRRGAEGEEGEGAEGAAEGEAPEPAAAAEGETRSES